MRQKQWNKVWNKNSAFVVIMWLAWFGIARWLLVHPLLYFTPFLGLLSSVLVGSHLNGLPETPVSETLGHIPLPPSNMDKDLHAIFKHDLLTPIRLIISFGDVILRANQRAELSSNLLIESVEAIARNAKKLENLITSIDVPVENAVDEQHEQIAFESLLSEALTLTADLTANRNIAVNLEIIKPLPQLIINRMFMLQALLNLLRGIAYPTTPSPTNDTLDIRVDMHNRALRTSLTTSRNRVQYTAASPAWAVTERLVEQQLGRLWLENKPDSMSTIFLSIPVTDGLSEITTQSTLTESIVKPNVIVVAAHALIIDLFNQTTSDYEYVVVQDIDALQSTMNTLQTQPLSIILTIETNREMVSKIIDLVEARIPIIQFTIPSSEQQLQKLGATYLTKPIDYDALLSNLEQHQLGHKMILVVDDNVDTTTMLGRMLASMPAMYRICKAHTAQAAKTLLQASHHDIGAVIIDLSLPDMDGINFIRQLRADQAFLNLPIILMSAHPTLEFMLHGLTTDCISVYRQGGFEVDTYALTIERLLKAFTPT